MKRLFIAEKPSMGKIIAEELSSIKKQSIKKDKTHYIVGDDIITWCFGHLMQTCMPQAYDEKFEKWSTKRVEWVQGNLPFIPSDWKFEISDDKKEQVKVIKKLISETDLIVHAGDPGREGQLIVDELLVFLKNKKPVKRILLNALDSQSIRDGLDSIEDNNKFKPLYYAGLTRSQADWIVGLNATMALTILSKNKGYDGVLSVGRVQTPTLSIIAKRDELIDYFKPKKHYLIQANFQLGQSIFPGKFQPKEDHQKFFDIDGYLINKDFADSIVKKIKNKSGKIIDKKENKAEVERPLPFSLSTIQTLCNEKFGLTASETLQVCQDLYIQKLTSYPRTDSQYLPTNQIAEVSEVLNAIQKNVNPLTSFVQEANTSIVSLAWNDKKVSDHHAIIPTRNNNTSLITKLSEVQYKVYQEICLRYLIQFYPKGEDWVTQLQISIEDEIFRANGIQVHIDGWRKIAGKIGQSESSIPKDIQIGDTVLCCQSENKESFTQPPQRFNDGTLINIMTNVHQLVENDEMKNKLKEVKGIGTSATRAEIIETLIKRGYLKRDKKSLITTDIGKSFIKILPNKMLDPALTAMWENSFESIASAKDVQDSSKKTTLFLDKLNQWIRYLIKEFYNLDYSHLPLKPVIERLDGDGAVCKKCKVGIMTTRSIKNGEHKGKTFLGCSNFPKCNHSEWR